MLSAVGSLATAFWAALNARTLLLAVIAFLFFADFKRRRPKNYPPGPWPLPLIGNIFHMDFEDPYLGIQQEEFICRQEVQERQPALYHMVIRNLQFLLSCWSVLHQRHHMQVLAQEKGEMEVVSKQLSLKALTQKMQT